MWPDEICVGIRNGKTERAELVCHPGTSRNDPRAILASHF